MIITKLYAKRCHKFTCLVKGDLAMSFFFRATGHFLVLVPFSFCVNTLVGAMENQVPIFLVYWSSFLEAQYLLVFYQSIKQRTVCCNLLGKKQAANFWPLATCFLINSAVQTSFQVKNNHLGLGMWGRGIAPTPKHRFWVSPPLILFRYSLERQDFAISTIFKFGNK